MLPLLTPRVFQEVCPNVKENVIPFSDEGHDAFVSFSL